MIQTTTFTPALYDYLIDVSLREHPVLRALRDETAKMPLGHMQIAPEVAQFMQMLIRLLRAKKVLEIGTFTGYSALSMALALPEDGTVITCDINSEWTKNVHFYWQQADQDKKIELKLAPALNTLDELLQEGAQQTFDFIFIDADKTNYIKYYQRALELISPHGLIAIDNVFWYGQVIDGSVTNAQTREIRKLNEYIKHDKRVNTSLLAIGDGLFLIQPIT